MHTHKRQCFLSPPSHSCWKDVSPPLKQSLQSRQKNTAHVRRVLQCFFKELPIPTFFILLLTGHLPLYLLVLCLYLYLFISGYRKRSWTLSRSGPPAAGAMCIWNNKSRTRRQRTTSLRFLLFGTLGVCGSRVGSWDPQKISVWYLPLSFVFCRPPSPPYTPRGISARVFPIFVRLFAAQAATFCPSLQLPVVRQNVFSKEVSYRKRGWFSLHSRHPPPTSNILPTVSTSSNNYRPRGS